MKPETEGFLEKAERMIRAAEILSRENDPESAVGRAYYAMLHTAQALLRERDLTYRKHSGVHAAFGEHFARKGFFDLKYHRWLLSAFDSRLKGDYDFDSFIDPVTASTVIEQAREFLKEARRFLEIEHG